MCTDGHYCETINPYLGIVRVLCAKISVSTVSSVPAAVSSVVAALVVFVSVVWVVGLPAMAIDVLTSWG